MDEEDSTGRKRKYLLKGERVRMVDRDTKTEDEGKENQCVASPEPKSLQKRGAGEKRRVRQEGLKRVGGPLTKKRHLGKPDDLRAEIKNVRARVIGGDRIPWGEDKGQQADTSSVMWIERVKENCGRGRSLKTIGGGKTKEGDVITEFQGRTGTNRRQQF